MATVVSYFWRKKNRKKNPEYKFKRDPPNWLHIYVLNTTSVVYKYIRKSAAHVCFINYRGTVTFHKRVNNWLGSFCFALLGLCFVVYFVCLNELGQCTIRFIVMQFRMNVLQKHLLLSRVVIAHSIDNQQAFSPRYLCHRTVDFSFFDLDFLISCQFANIFGICVLIVLIQFQTNTPFI